ncbi:hypothetical protein C8R46DRAFT_670326 [Mycena filopes]|nr:hypothetical protein C8R46DRAFT_670326 [Mycena filopes]
MLNGQKMLSPLLSLLLLILGLLLRFFAILWSDLEITGDALNRSLDALAAFIVPNEMLGRTRRSHSGPQGSLTIQLSDPAFHSSADTASRWVGTVRVHEKTYILDNSYSSETHRSDIHLQHPPSPPRRQARLDPLPFDSVFMFSRRRRCWRRGHAGVQQPEEVPTQSVKICVRRHRKSTWVYWRILLWTRTRCLTSTAATAGDCGRADAPCICEQSRRCRRERRLATDTPGGIFCGHCLRGAFAALLVPPAHSSSSSARPSSTVSSSASLNYPSSSGTLEPHGLVVGCSLLVLVLGALELFHCPSELIVGAHQRTPAVSCCLLAPCPRCTRALPVPVRSHRWRAPVSRPPTSAA